MEIHEEAGGKLLIVQSSGKLTRDDYRLFVPRVERLLGEVGELRILFDMHDFHGWDLSAAWEDAKFGLKHAHHIERLALVGEKTWEHQLANLWRPFTRAKVRYFDRKQASEALQWLRAGLSSSVAPDATGQDA